MKRRILFASILAVLLAPLPTLADRAVPGPSGSGATAPDATTSSKGSVRLSGELDGVASAPTLNPCGSTSTICARVVPGSDIGIGIQTAWNSLMFPGGAARTDGVLRIYLLPSAPGEYNLFTQYRFCGSTTKPTGSATPVCDGTLGPENSDGALVLRMRSVPGAGSLAQAEALGIARGDGREDPRDRAIACGRMAAWRSC